MGFLGFDDFMDFAGFMDYQIDDCIKEIINLAKDAKNVEELECIIAETEDKYGVTLSRSERDIIFSEFM